MPVFGYIRVSTDEQVDGTSLGEQRRVIEGLAMQAGLEGVEILEDGGISGSVPIFGRPAGARLAAVTSGDSVIVAKVDRFSRDAADALTVIKGWEGLGVRLIIGGFGDVLGEHAKGSAGRLLIEIMAVFAGHERRMIRERQRDGQRAKRQQGGHIGGAAPFGYRKIGAAKSAVLEPDPAQQEAISTIRARAGTGDSLRKIAAAVLAVHAIKVSAPTVARVLKASGAELGA